VKGASVILSSMSWDWSAVTSANVADVKAAPAGMVVGDVPTHCQDSRRPRVSR